MTDVNKVVDLLDDEDDDCVVQSVIYGKCNKHRSKLYYKVYKDSELLGNIIEKCLSLEKSSNMFNMLKNLLVESYYKVEKSVRDTSKIQRALQRAINLLYTEPNQKYTHIQDLCNILKASHPKKKVPFITLSTDLKTTDKKSDANSLKRNSEEPIDADSSKKPKLNTEVPAPSSSNAFNDTTESLDDSVSTINCSQSSCVSEEESLLIPMKDVPIEAVDPLVSAKEEELKNLERKIARYKKEISKLDELEVTDDSVNSPYIKSERLKSKVVDLYKELCKLTGSKPAKKQGIRLKVIEGHPPGPTKILESYLNKNIDSNGDLPFPDFNDVVNCVTECNEKDDLGWTKAQIMKEAYMLFTHCGRALQKRRQSREYRNLLRKVKIEETDRDPAEDDPELLAKLEENRLRSVKKEDEILERYTMMQELPSKAKSQTQRNNNNDYRVSTDTQNTSLKDNNHQNSLNIEQMDVDTANCETAPVIQSTTSNVDNSDILLCKDINKDIDGVSNDDQNKENNNHVHNNTRPCDIGVAKVRVPEDTAVLQNQHNKATIGSSCAVDQMKTNIKMKPNNEEKCNVIEVINIEMGAMNEYYSATTSKNSVKKDTPGLENQHKKTSIGLVVHQNKSNNMASADIVHVTQYTINEIVNKDNSVYHSNKTKDDNKLEYHTTTTIVGCNSEDNRDNIETNMVIKTKIKQEPEEDVIKELKSLGENFSVTVNTVFDPFLIVEISSDNSDKE